MLTTKLNVNALELQIEYELDVSSIYFGDLESSYIETSILRVLWHGNDVLPLIKALEMEETLKHILEDRFEDYEN